MFAPAEAARFLDDAHRTRARYQNLPAAIASANRGRSLCRAGGTVRALGPSGWVPWRGCKIATTTKVMQQLMGIDHPCGGMIFSSRVHRSPARIRKADYVNVRIECELAVRLGRDAAASASSPTRARACGPRCRRSWPPSS